MKTVFVIGSTGDVGQGIVEALLTGGHRVIAAARTLDRLQAVQARLTGLGPLQIVAGSVDDADQAVSLRRAMIELAGAPDGVVTALSSHEWDTPSRVLDRDEATFQRIFHDNLFLHFQAAKTFIPALAPGGSFVAINGGLGDHIIPGMGHLSMVQAAQRAMFQAIAHETAESGIHVRVLGLYSMISGQRSRSRAEPDWITAEQVGERVTALIAGPDAAEGVVHALKSAKYR